jgi:DNA-binding transcriptional MerR regulator
MAKGKQIQMAFDFSEPVEEVVVAPAIETAPLVEEILHEETITPLVEVQRNEPIALSEVIMEDVVAKEVEEDKNEAAEILAEETTPIIQKIAPPKPSVRGRKSIKMMELEADLIEVPNDEQLFSKMYYTMGDVTEMFKVNHSLIRFWEAEFDILKPRKNGKGDRLFRPEDVKNLEIIYYLLRQKKYTIEGAKDYLKNKKKLSQQFEAIQKLEKLKAFLLEVKAGL